MRRAEVAMHGIPAGILEERMPGKQYAFEYLESYAGPPVSLTMPLRTGAYLFISCPKESSWKRCCDRTKLTAMTISHNSWRWAMIWSER
jgi:hypothetical protein